MAAEQDWCLQCGAAAPGSLHAGSRQWRFTAAVLSAVALLVAGAAVAAYAAFSKSSAKPRAASATLTRTPVPSGSAPGGAATPPPTTPAAPTPATPKLGAPAKPHLPLVKHPNTAPAGAVAKPPATTSPATTTPAAPGTTTTPAPSTKTPAGSTEKQPVAIVLDTNAASTYNPYSYPATRFGDASLAIDGETSTGWTAKVDRAVAPKMAEGLLIDMKASQRLSALVLTSSTPGMTVQVYGSAGHAAPSSITDRAWVRLSGVLVDRKHSLRIRLANSKHPFRFVTLWISAAPASAGHVSVNELELFPAR
jgi:hypothetical protein